MAHGNAHRSLTIDIPRSLGYASACAKADRSAANSLVARRSAAQAGALLNDSQGFTRMSVSGPERMRLGNVPLFSAEIRVAPKGLRTGPRGGKVGWIASLDHSTTCDNSVKLHKMDTVPKRGPSAAILGAVFSERYQRHAIT